MSKLKKEIIRVHLKQKLS